MHYQLRLFDFFHENIRKETSIEELAHIWQCSTRYAKTIIKKLQHDQIVKWEATKGRGKKPVITMIQSKEACIIRLFTSYWEKHKFEEAYAFIGEYDMLNHPTIQKWLQKQYGILQNEKSQHILRLPFFHPNVEFNPLEAHSNWDAHLIKQIHEPLFKENEQNGEIETNLLFTFETNDYRTWRFILRKGVYFHNLKPVQAIDIQFSLERLAQFAKPYFDYKKFEIINDHELILTLSKPFTILPQLLATFRTVILPKDKPDGTIGCGAFILESYSPYKIQLTAFDHYFNKRPFIDGIEFLLDKTDSNFGISNSPFPSDIPQKELFMKQLGTDYIVLNMQKGPLQNKALRETIFALIDPKTYINNALNESVASNWLPNKEQPFSAKIRCTGNDFPMLKIGYQYLSAQSNYSAKAFILQQQLYDFGIKTELTRVDVNKTKAIDTSIDIFIGGAVFGKHKILSILNLYFTEPQAILSFLDAYHRHEVIQTLEKMYTTEQGTEEASLNELIAQTEKVYCLKFLTHHQRQLYIRDDYHYKNLKFDTDGFIQYNQIFFDGN